MGITIGRHTVVAGAICVAIRISGAVGVAVRVGWHVAVPRIAVGLLIAPVTIVVVGPVPVSIPAITIGNRVSAVVGVLGIPTASVSTRLWWWRVRIIVAIASSDCNLRIWLAIRIRIGGTIRIIGIRGSLSGCV